MLKQSNTDEFKFGNKEMDEVKFGNKEMLRLRMSRNLR